MLVTQIFVTAEQRCQFFFYQVTILNLFEYKKRDYFTDSDTYSVNIDNQFFR